MLRHKLKLADSFKQHKRFIFIVFIAVLVQFLVGVIVFFGISINQLQKQLDQKIWQIKTDVRFENDAWDLSLYNSDPLLLEKDPLYFIAVDGFVLDRRSPVRGFLDTSDYKRLLSYTTPQTIKNITGNLRRVYAKPIMDQGKSYGVVAVSYYNPPDEVLPQIDLKLTQTADDILATISVHQGVVDTSQLDARKIPYDISFTIVDAYNSILTKTTNVTSFDRIPNFIDPSYVKNITASRPTRFIRDSQTDELFLIQVSQFLKDSNLIAIIAVGLSVEPVLDVFKGYFMFGGVASLFIISWVFSMVVFTKSTKEKDAKYSNVIKQVLFSEKKGKLVINGISIKIPYATNQYYLLKMLFSRPSKRWETDELLDRFGIDVDIKNSRKVYDAMISINKKVYKVVPIKLILNQNKTYQLNQEFSILS